MLSLLFAGLLHLQGQENQLSMFDPFIGKTWSAEGNWGDGSAFKQDITFRYDLNRSLVVAEANGHTNEERTTYGPRNHGLRKYDAQTGTVKFWEFDVFGGVTEGTLVSKGKDLIYTYAYGESVVTDYWEYEDDYTYNLTIGSYENGEWKKKYLSTQFTTPKGSEPEFHFDHQSIVVKDVQKMGDFYKEVFALEEVPHPENKPGFRWFNVYGNSQLHLIQKEFKDFEKNKSMHLCLAVKDLDAFITHLKSKNIDFYDWPGKKGSVTDRADGVKQIYIQDPEGYWVEINTAKHN